MIDLQSGEKPSSDMDKQPSAQAVEGLLYAQPCLKASTDERGPMPYRRELETNKEGKEDATGSTSTKIMNDHIELSNEGQSYEV
jgi:hypothetical protein